MKTYTPSRGILYLFCVLLATILTASAQKKVLFYGPTHAAGGVAETLIANNPTEFAQLGFGSAIWTPGHSSAALDWLQKTSNDFAAFDVIFIGEPGAPNVSSTLLQGAIANRSIWSSAVSGNIIIMTGDPQFHSGYPGAQEYIEQALRFAAADLAPGPGLYVASGLLHPAESPIDDSKGALEHLLDQIGPFSVMSHASGQNVTKFGSHPLLDTLTNEELSGWTSSAHGGLHDWPSNFRPVALVTDNSQNPVSTDTPSSKLPPGYRGLVHVVARGDIKRLTIDPVKACKMLNDSITLTARWVNQAGTGISAASIKFEIMEGPNQGLSSSTLTTDANGYASWNYSGVGGIGTDVIRAYVLGSTPAPETIAHVHWSDQSITLTVLDSTAAETLGTPNIGRFKLTRGGTTLDSLGVTISLSGTATVFTDYNIQGAGTTSVFFEENQTEQLIDIEPIWDENSEVPETVILRVVQLDQCTYVVMGTPEGTVTITSAQLQTITLTASATTISESSTSPISLNVIRNSGSGELYVTLQVGGTATYGVDYTISGLEEDGTVYFGSSVTTRTLSFLPVSDSRSENYPSGENAIIAIAPASDPANQGSYIVAAPAQSQRTITITDDDGPAPPSNLTFTITPIMNFSGCSSYARGINDTVPPTVAVMFFNNAENEKGGYKWVSNSSYQLISQYDPIEPFGMAPGTSTLVVGGYDDTSSSYPWATRDTTFLDGLGGYQTIATDIGVNSFGTETIVGYSVHTPSGYFRAVRWVGGSTTAQNLGTLAPTFVSRNSYSLAVNSHGVVVGYSGVDAPANAVHAFKVGSLETLDAAVHDLGTMNSGFGNSKATAINDLDEIVGESSIIISGNAQTRAFYRIPGPVLANSGFVDLGVLSGGNRSTASAINHKGYIVGSSRTTSTGSDRAVLWFPNGTRKNLSANEPSLPGNISNPTGWTLYSASGINANGYIIGQGAYNGVTCAFMLTPSVSY